MTPLPFLPFIGLVFTVSMAGDIAAVLSWTDSARCLPAAGGSVASYLTMSRGVGYSLGASGAVFGLFAVSVLCKLSFNFKKLLEAAILGQFVVKQVLQVLHSMCPSF